MLGWKNGVTEKSLQPNAAGGAAQAWLSAAALESAPKRSETASGVAALHQVRAVMTRWLAVVGCVFSVPVAGVVLIDRPEGWNPWVTLGMCGLFPAALLVHDRHHRLAGMIVSFAFFASVALGGYLNLGTSAVTINAAYATCVVIASACWSSRGSFAFALLGGALATYSAYTHAAIPAAQAYLAGAKVASLLLVLAFVQRALLAKLARARGHMAALEERLGVLIGESPEGILVLDAALCVRLANPSAARMTGLGAEQLLGERLGAMGWLDPASLSRLSAHLREQNPASGLELYSVSGDNVFDASLSVLTHSEGGWKYLVVLRDITAKRAEAEAHEELQRRVRESTALESLGRLAGGIAHDFNNLLTVIINTTDLSSSRGELSEIAASELGTVRAAAEKAAELTAQLLAVARRQVLRPVVMCPNQGIEELFPLLQRLLPESVKLNVCCADDLGNASADPSQLGQVLVNLVTNAVDAMAQGGTLTIETDNVTLDARHASSFTDIQAGDYVCISVSDTGAGMSDATLSRIFEPFFTTKDKERGTGLGLATAHGIIRQSGGHIHVYSEPDQGTTFRIYLPRVGEPVAIRKPSDGVVTQAIAPLRILLVEDQEQVRLSVHRLLRHLGHQVCEAEDGAAALARYAASAKELDVLLTDVIMPGLSGPELAESLRARNPDLRVLYMSGYTENAIVHHGALDAGVEYLAKPFNLSALRKALARLR